MTLKWLHVCSVTVLVLCVIEKKTREETQLLITLAAPSILTYHNEINCADILRVIIFLIKASAHSFKRLLHGF